MLGPPVPAQSSEQRGQEHGEETLDISTYKRSQESNMRVFWSSGELWHDTERASCIHIRLQTHHMRIIHPVSTHPITAVAHPCAHECMHARLTPMDACTHAIHTCESSSRPSPRTTPRRSGKIPAPPARPSSGAAPAQLGTSRQEKQQYRQEAGPQDRPAR